MKTKLTKKEQEWFDSLEKCLKKMPKSLEILVQESYNGSEKLVSEVYVMGKGSVHQGQQEVDDLAIYNPDEKSLDKFMVDQVAANNHGY
ncbi:hypothetical protein L1267_17870 [Pseudoalteromonas sp. OFAV1]|uniref:hypothetical protein n=1 Tax=Pseudoalteromonas sp. OFAV1 TaxID=2908892 RepID=UPI001F363D58|nr:hypothetical protein [Pseudoalteromonas sp. OFAV1]MCF2902240.1 hypothetical protein [Pseudoalteromonas sp. OFAV1]